jgi:hypothetical protein
MRQMLGMSARVADGIMMSDLPPKLAQAALAKISNDRAAAGNSDEPFWSSTFTAWHVYADKETARREACQWMLLRGLFRPWVLSEFLEQSEVELVMNNAQSFVDAFVNQTHEIKNIPDELLNKLVDNLTLTASLDNLDQLIEHLLQYKAIGLQSISLRIYTDPAASIKLIGEQIIPALQ